MSAVLKEFPEARQHFVIKAFGAPLGPEVLGLDLSRPISGDDFARLHRAHLEHHVLRQFQLPSDPEVLIVPNIRETGRNTMRIPLSFVQKFTAVFDALERLTVRRWGMQG